MPLLTITPHDCLISYLRITLELVVKCDICDPSKDFPEVREEAHARLRKIRAEAAAQGYTFEELYGDVISDEEGRADFKSECAEGVELD